MDIQNVLWKLHALGDCSVLEPETREAAKLAADVLNNVRNIANLGSVEDLVSITQAVREMAKANAHVPPPANAENALKALHEALPCDAWGALPREIRDQVNAIVQA